MEILAPAGSFQIALSAFEVGADGVYLGLKDFSARRGAQNFTMEELRRLRAYHPNKKIYLALNTIIKESEFSKIVPTLFEADLIGIDAIIIQDLGLLFLARREFPDLAIHASTQMAVNNSAGIEFLQSLGVKRVVLARELSLQSIRELAQGHPQMELEVFIHGALCYSYSGLCLASGLLLNRSANRGECAQICRTYFEHDKDRGYYFSCNDLALEEKILQLGSAGITSLKIEGRMKSLQYVSHTVGLYRAILDGKRDIVERSKGARVSFSRKQCLGYLYHSNGENLINPHYPGHYGLLIGSIREAKGRRLRLSSKEPLERYDSLSFHTTDKKSSPPLGGMIVKIRDLKGEVRKNTPRSVEVEINTPLPMGNYQVYLTKRAAKARSKSVDIKDFPLFYCPIDIEVQLSDTAITLRAMSAHFFLKAAYPVMVDQAKGGLAFETAFKSQLQKIGSGRFKPGKLCYENLTRFESPFIPPSQLKEIRRDFYRKCEERFLSLSQGIDLKGSVVMEKARTLERGFENFIQKRGSLSPKGKGQPIPFFHSMEDISLGSMARYNEYHFVPLSPILLDAPGLFSALRKLLYENSSVKFLVGINSVSHLYLCKEWLDLVNVKFYIDFYAYMANHNAINMMVTSLTLEKVKFAYYWIEGDEYPLVRSRSSLPLVAIDDKECLPLFISRSCFYKESFGGCPPKCKRTYSFTLKNQKRLFPLHVLHCHTFLYSRPLKQLL